MASALRPKKSSALVTSRKPGVLSRPTNRKSPTRRARGGLVKVARAKIPSLELYVTLLAGAENLSVAAARGLLRLRQVVLAAQEAAIGALIRLESWEDGRLDWFATAAKSPILSDFVSLICLQLIDDFPQHSAAIRRLLAGCRSGFDLGARALRMRDQAVDSPWLKAARKKRIDDILMLRVLPLAVWAVQQMLGASMLRHLPTRLPRSKRCPVCKGLPYARQTGKFLCRDCETRWPAARDLDCTCSSPHPWKRVDERSAVGFEVLNCTNDKRTEKCTVYSLDDSMSEAFSPFWYVKLVRLLDERKP